MFHAMNLEVAKTDVIDNPWDYVNDLESKIKNEIPNMKDSALFLLVSGKHSITGDQSISEIYEKFKDPEDGFLYIAYASELTWG